MVSKLLIRDYRLRLHRPACDPSAEWLNAVGLLRDDITEVLPYLNATIKGCIYNPRTPGLTFLKEGHRITVRPRELAVSKCTDEQEARALLDWLQQTINETWERRESIEPNYHSVGELAAIEAYKLLPGTNCGECGESTCLAFATKLVMHEANITACSPLFSGAFEEKRQALIDELTARGYEVPAELTT